MSKAVDVGEFLEQDGLALHHRLGRQPADVAQPQHRRAVGHHRHEVAPRGIIPCRVGVFLDLDAGLGDAGRIGAGQIAPVGEGLGRPDLELAGLGIAVIVERRLTEAFAGAVAGGVGHGAVLWLAIVQG
jgi:hypothetical protein